MNREDDINIDRSTPRVELTTPMAGFIGMDYPGLRAIGVTPKPDNWVRDRFLGGDQ